MATTTPEWRVGDNWKPISGTIVDGDGNPVDVSGADTLTFVALSGTTNITGTATNLDDGTTPNRGRWSYTWTDTDLATAGTYEVLIRVTTGSDVESFPSNKSNDPSFVVTANNDGTTVAVEAAKPRRSMRAAV